MDKPLGICQIEGCDKETKRPGGHSYTPKFCKEHYKLGMSLSITGRKIQPDGAKNYLTSGYINIKRNGSWIPEHRAVMEDVLGRPLRKGESVHHKNGIRSDNRPENLELWIGAVRNGQRAVDVYCPDCGVSYWDNRNKE